MTEMTPVNPYLPAADDETLPFAPFVGRQKAFERLYQQLTDPKAGTTVILGRRQVGKTALLQHFHSVFDETFVSVYMPLKQMPIEDEAAWLKLLARRTMFALTERNFTLSHLPGEPPAEGDIRAWFQEEYLREVINIIRRHRRLVVLIDDAAALFTPAPAGATDEPLSGFFHQLLQEYSHFRVVVALDADYEANLSRLSPLASLTNVYRLTNLSPDESALLLQEPVQSFYTVSPEAATAVYQVTGGQPALLQRFGHHLFRLYETTLGLSVMTSDQVKQVTPVVYAESEADFRRTWQDLNQNEQLVLRAITELFYNDPLAGISPQAIAAWLIESDFPLDSTAIHAALRSLEYRELVSTAPVQISAGMMQTWLLDNIRQARVLKSGSPNVTLSPLKNRWRLVAAGIAGAIVLVLLILLIVGSPQGRAELPPQPTVTLVTTPTQP